VPAQVLLSVNSAVVEIETCVRLAAIMREHCSRFVLALTLTVVGCEPDPPGDDGSEAPECIEYELDGCTALYPATYDQVWTQTLSNSCAQSGSACHAQAGSGGAVDGLVLVDPQASWDHMMSAELIVPGDPRCSPLFVRLATDDPAIRMPPGSSGLPPTALCSIGTWISEGAEYTAP
jgi:hypothetical protein